MYFFLNSASIGAFIQEALLRLYCKCEELSVTGCASQAVTLVGTCGLGFLLWQIMYS